MKLITANKNLDELSEKRVSLKNDRKIINAYLKSNLIDIIKTIKLDFKFLIGSTNKEKYENLLNYNLIQNKG